MKGATTDYNSTHPIRVPLACISQIETAGSGEFFPMHTKIPCAVINEQPLEGWEYQRIGKIGGEKMIYRRSGPSSRVLSNGGLGFNRRT
ncbi:hypothetical protein JTE90_010813 [Oedothorax gibbosus]|uniref:Uncharacterized protein n=1 Tax=Oedothorax gibbosus TaxID=931172 RepID=A0AAV6V2W0_9ARAC|nr:hypothetical protein JTE90_010813 [Oedothorax gibbosus]